jgi:hypothetical protein
MRRATAVAAVVLLAGCSGPGSEIPTGPREDAVLRIETADTPAARAAKLAAFVEQRWPGIRVLAQVTTDGDVASFRLTPDYDSGIGSREAYYAHLRRLTSDLHQASVELLEAAVEHLPGLRYASAWDDPLLMAYWTPEQIAGFGDPRRYRDLAAWQHLVVTAAQPPPVLVRETLRLAHP